MRTVAEVYRLPGTLFDTTTVPSIAAKLLLALGAGDSTTAYSLALRIEQIVGPCPISANYKFTPVLRYGQTQFVKEASRKNA